MIKFKLSNVLLQVQDHFSAFPGILYKANGAVDYSMPNDSLAFEGKINFLTYFNAISCEKWQRYASIDNINLYVELSGDPCEITMMGVDSTAVSESDNPPIKVALSESAVHTDVVAHQVLDAVKFAGSHDYRSFEIALPLDGLLLGGFTLNTEGATEIRNAYWYTNVSEDRIRPIKLALSTTTFQKEEYVIPNIEAIKKDILNCEDAVARAFHMFVIDNGRTLDADSLSNDGVTVLPNPNTGGSGGFARGMIEALASEEGFTHVLLMDDDVKVSPESLKRTFNLLSLTNDAYMEANINGAMLEIGCPNKQYEDVSHVRADGLYEQLKGELFIDDLADIAVNEKIDVEVPDAYGAWWYSCIPISRIKKCGLPLPFFIRCDDVEYGVRCQSIYMSMNGICVWHEGFGSKFRPAFDIYQFVRNFLIMTALHERSNESLFLARWSRTLRLYLRAMAYESAEILVSAFEDYMQGPEFLMNSSGEEIVKRSSLMAEKLVPSKDAIRQAIEEHPELEGPLSCFAPDLGLVNIDNKAGFFLKIFRTLPYDRHVLPKQMLNNKPATIYSGGFSSFSASQLMSTVYVAYDRDGDSSHVRVMDRDRRNAIKDRWKKARKYYSKHGKEIRQAYKDALPEMTSMEFWSDYLGLNR